MKSTKAIRILRTTFVAILLALPGLVSPRAALPFDQPVFFDLAPSWQTQDQATSGSQAVPAGVPPEAVARGRSLESNYIAHETSGTLFKNVATVLTRRYYDSKFRRDVLPKLVSEYADKAKRASTLKDQRDVVEEMLSHIPSSHLGLMSTTTHKYISADLEGRSYPTFGVQVIEEGGKFYAFFVLEGGPAQRAGLRPWDRIVSIDDVPAEKSSRVDWRSDDAYIADDRDPPVHYLLTEKGDTLKLKIERKKDKFITLSIKAEDYPPFAAAKASARLYKVDGRDIAYIHIWYVHMSGVPELLKSKMEGEFGKCDGFVLDLRGRGGNGMAIARILDVVESESKSRHWPVVALIDRQSTSAKDILAYELKKRGIATLVGEPTAGAVIPASFADVGHDSVLMFPSFKLGKYTDLLESKPTKPDVFVERAGPLSGGEDPILNAGLAEEAKLIKRREK